MNQGDIYAVDLDPIKGKEQAGRRPVLVVSRREFNRVTGLPIVAPITQGGEYSREKGFTVALSGTGTKTQGVVLCHQVRVLDIKARNGTRVESLPKPVLDDVINHIIPIIQG